MFNQIVKASMGAYSVPAVLHAVQGDDGRVLVFHIEDYTLTGSETASLMCIRPNGSAFSYAGVVDGVNQKITVALDQEGGALTQTGVVAAQLIVALSGETVCTFKLGIIVEEALGGEATTEDVEFLAELQAQLDQAIGNFVQTSREINGHPLSANISLTAADVGAVPTTRTVNGKALSENITLEASDFAAGNMASLTYTQVASW